MGEGDTIGGIQDSLGLTGVSNDFAIENNPHSFQAGFYAGGSGIVPDRFLGSLMNF
jgi:hypothetical protein